MKIGCVYKVKTNTKLSLYNIPNEYITRKGTVRARYRSDHVLNLRGTDFFSFTKPFPLFYVTDFYIHHYNPFFKSIKIAILKPISNKENKFYAIWTSTNLFERIFIFDALETINYNEKIVKNIK